MKTLRFLSLFFAGAALGISTVFANSVTISKTAFNGVPDLNGGEFWAVTSNNGSFLTFCAEKVPTFVPGTAYSYTIDNNVLNQNDPLSNGTVYLYENFLNGTLAGYTANHDVNAGLLQQAIWMLEGDETYNSANIYIKLVEGIYIDQAGAMADANSLHVKALNLWSYDEKGALVDHQSQLIYVPDSSYTLILIGLSMMGFGLIRRFQH